MMSGASLVVPSEYARDISKHSGFLGTKSVWAGKTLKGLFRAPQNVEYIKQQLFSLVTHPQFIHDHCEITTSIGENIGMVEQSNFVEDGVKHGIARPTFRGEPFRNKHTKPTLRDHEIARQFRLNKETVYAAVPAMIEEYVLPYMEDQKTKNPIMELHYVNLDFLVTHAEMLVQNPTTIVDNFRNWNDDRGAYDEDIPDYEYSAESWNDGTWHPEHLFTNSEANKRAGYWKSEEVEFWNGPVGYPSADNVERNAIKQADLRSGAGLNNLDPEALEAFQADYDDPNIYIADTSQESGGRGPGNKWKHIALPNIELEGTVSEERRGDDRGIYNNTGSIVSGRRGRFANGGQVPFWQTTMHHRPYDREFEWEGLSEGGRGDRRVQKPHGYNMTALTNRSSTQVNHVPPYRKM